MTQPCGGPPRLGSAEGPKVVCLAVNASDIPQNPAPAQENNRAHGITRAPHLRLVAPPPPTRPRRRLAVRIHVLDGPAPYGISRTIRLIGPDDVDRLVDFALRLEARRP
jgi:hypothetical protein